MDILIIIMLVCIGVYFLIYAIETSNMPNGKSGPTRKKSPVHTSDKWTRKANCGGTHSWIVDGEISPYYIKSLDQKIRTTKSNDKGIISVESKKPF